MFPKKTCIKSTEKDQAIEVGRRVTENAVHVSCGLESSMSTTACSLYKLGYAHQHSTRWASKKYIYIYVTVPDKRDHFRQYFKIELLVLKGRVALKQ